MSLPYQERQRLIEKALEENPGMENLNLAELRSALAVFVGKRLEGTKQSILEKRELTEKLIHSMRGLDILQPLLNDPEISEIMVNGPQNIFIERKGKLERCPFSFDNEEHLLRVISRCFGQANRLINEQRPIASLRFPDGSRLQAVLPPASPDGPALSLRRFGRLKPDLRGLVLRGSLSAEAASYLENAVRERKNIFISGGTGSGKTTFLNALSAAIPANERVITIEDTAELDLLRVPNLLRLEAREAAPGGEGEISLETLIRAALRLRPDRIIVGEVRGLEAYAMIEAMRSGHPGSMSTGHADSPQGMAERLALLLMRSLQLPWAEIMRILCRTLDLIVQLVRSSAGERQVSVIGIPACSGEGHFHLLPVFFRTPEGQLVRTEEQP